MQIPLVLEIRDKAQDKLNTDVGIVFSQTVEFFKCKIERRAAKVGESGIWLGNVPIAPALDFPCRRI